MKGKKEVAGKEEGEKLCPKRAQKVHFHLPQKNTSPAKKKKKSCHAIE